MLLSPPPPTPHSVAFRAGWHPGVPLPLLPSCWLALLCICGRVFLPDCSSNKGTNSSEAERQSQAATRPVPSRVGSREEPFSWAVQRDSGLAGMFGLAQDRHPGFQQHSFPSKVWELFCAVRMCGERALGHIHNPVVRPEIESRASLPADVRLGPIGSSLLSRPTP